MPWNQFRIHPTSSRPFLIVALCLLCGCDLAGRVILKNRSGEEAHVRVVRERRSGEIDEYTMLLAPEGSKARRQILTGWWQGFRGTALEENLRQFRRIDIISSHDSTSFAGATLRSKFIEGRQPGLFGLTCVWKIR